MSHSPNFSAGPRANIAFQKAAVYLLVCTILFLIRTTYDMVIAVMYANPSHPPNSSPGLYLYVVGIILDLWPNFILYTILFALGHKKANGLWSTEQPFMMVNPGGDYDPNKGYQNPWVFNSNPRTECNHLSSFISKMDPLLRPTKDLRPPRCIKHHHRSTSNHTDKHTSQGTNSSINKDINTPKLKPTRCILRNISLLTSINHTKGTSLRTRLARLRRATLLCMRWVEAAGHQYHQPRHLQVTIKRWDSTTRLMELRQGKKLCRMRRSREGALVSRRRLYIKILNCSWRVMRGVKCTDTILFFYQDFYIISIFISILWTC